MIMKKLIETQLFRMVSGNEELPDSELEFLFDDFANEIMQLSENENNEFIFRSLNYTKIRLGLCVLKTPTNEMEKKCTNYSICN